MTSAAPPLRYKQQWNGGGLQTDRCFVHHHLWDHPHDDAIPLVGLLILGRCCRGCALDLDRVDLQMPGLPWEEGP